MKCVADAGETIRKIGKTNGILGGKIIWSVYLGK